MNINKSAPRFSGSKCTRCGKPRIVIDSYEEKVEKSTVVYTIASCSDPECQKIVDRLLVEEERKRGVIKSEQEKRELLRNEAKANRKNNFTI